MAKKVELTEMKYFWGLVILAVALVAVVLLLLNKKTPQTETLSNINMRISSSAFSDNSTIPDKYSCVGENINPPLTFLDVPSQTASLALVMDDPDAPRGTFDHWVVWNILPDIKEIMEGSKPFGVVGRNGRGKNDYTGPCPPSGTHHYHFKLYALDSMLAATSIQTKTDLENAMQGHILDQAELIGLFEHK